jgi:hypothetical protein
MVHLFQFFFSTNANQLVDSKVDCVTVNDGVGADAKFESKGAEAKGGGDDTVHVEDLKSEVGAMFDEASASCIVVCCHFVLSSSLH